MRDKLKKGLDFVYYVKRVRRGGGIPPELIPEYASASNAIIFYKQSTVKKYEHTTRRKLNSDMRLAWREKIYASISYCILL